MRQGHFSSASLKQKFQLTWPLRAEGSIWQVRLGHFSSAPQAKIAADLTPQGQRLHLAGEAGPCFLSLAQEKIPTDLATLGHMGHPQRCGRANALGGYGLHCLPLRGHPSF